MRAGKRFIGKIQTLKLARQKSVLCSDEGFKHTYNKKQMPHFLKGGKNAQIVSIDKFQVSNGVLLRKCNTKWDIVSSIIDFFNLSLLSACAWKILKLRVDKIISRLPHVYACVLFLFRKKIYRILPSGKFNCVNGTARPPTVYFILSSRNFDNLRFPEQGFF